MTARPDRGGVILAECPGCGERDQQTFADQWTGDDVPPWRGDVPRCGFCGGRLVVRPGRDQGVPSLFDGIEDGE